MPISLWKKRQILSRRGEKLAEAYLKQRGYSIIERRYWTRFGEIDLIAKKGPVLAFVEVKTRKGFASLDPLVSITLNKWKRLQRASMIFLNKYSGDKLSIHLEFLGIGVGIEAHKTKICCVPLFDY